MRNLFSKAAALAKARGLSARQFAREVGISVAAASMILAGNAQAQFVVPTEITDAATSVGLVGAAVFAIMVAIKLYKWLKRAL